MDSNGAWKIDCLYQECLLWAPDKSPHCGAAQGEGSPLLPDNCVVFVWLNARMKQQEERHQKDLDERDHALGHFELVTPSFMEMLELLWDIVKGRTYNICTCPPGIEGHEPWCMINRLIDVTERALVARDCVQSYKEKSP